MLAVLLTTSVPGYVRKLDTVDQIVFPFFLPFKRKAMIAIWSFVSVGTLSK